MQLKFSKLCYKTLPHWNSITKDKICFLYKWVLSKFKKKFQSHSTYEGGVPEDASFTFFLYKLDLPDQFYASFMIGPLT